MDEEMLRFLKDEYYKTVPDKLSQMRSLIDSLKENWNKDNLIAFRFTVHKIAGSAGSFGYERVSEICKVVEQSILDELGHFDPFHVNKELLVKFDHFFESIKLGFACEYP